MNGQMNQTTLRSSPERFRTDLKLGGMVQSGWDTAVTEHNDNDFYIMKNIFICSDELCTLSICMQIITNWKNCLKVAHMEVMAR